METASGASRRDRLAASVAAVVPGLVWGSHLAGLIFFLNPHLPFTFSSVGRGILVYGGLGGIVGWVTAIPWIWRRPDRILRTLPWMFAAALAFAAILDAAHASRFAYYLPPGINVRLLKTAFWLGLGAAIAFYTALLHTLDRRAYGWKSRCALALLAALSLYAMVERRDAFRPTRPSGARRPTYSEGQRPRLWVVGVEGATLDAILPLAGQGRLPTFEALLREGAYGPLEAIRPPRRSALWTTLATGKYPWRHGVAGGAEYAAEFLCASCRLTILPRGLAFGRWGTFGSPAEAVPQRRSALALWEILGQLGERSGVVAWPAAPPFSSMTSFGLPEARFQRRGIVLGEVPSNVGFWTEALRPEEVVLPSQRDNRLARAERGDLWRTRSLELLLKQFPESSAIFLALPGLTEVSRQSFGGFAAVEFEGSSRAEDRKAAARVAEQYARVDDLLGGLLQLDRGAMVAVVSPYGFAPVGWSERWKGLSQRAGSSEESPDGVLFLRGPGVRAGALLTESKIVDLVPTLLYALGYPVAKDFDGRVATAAFEADLLELRSLTFVSSYEGAPATEAASGR